jgi:hypothetical protein
MENFKYLRSLIAKDARCTRKIKSRIALAEAVFSKKTFKHQLIGLIDRKETSEMVYSEHSFV